MTTNGAADLPFWVDHKTGEVVFRGGDGVEHRLRPTMEATLEIERGLGAGIDAVRTRTAVATLPGIDSRLTLTTDELGVIVAAGMRAAGAPASPAEAAKVIWSAGRDKTQKAIFEFVWGCCDGGRLRADDLKNGASPPGSQPEPSGGGETDPGVIQEVAERLSGSSSG